VTVAARRLIGKGNVGYIGPGLHGEYRLGFLLRTELAEAGNPVLVHGARRRRGQERVGQFDFAAAVLVLVGSTVAQQLGRRLLDGKGGVAIDREIAAAVILMAETVDLVIRRTRCSQCCKGVIACSDRSIALFFIFDINTLPCLAMEQLLSDSDDLWRDRPITRPMEAKEN